MTGLFNVINQYLFAPILRLFTTLTNGNFALGILLFTLAINILLIPLSIKSQKASVQQIKIKPKLDELKKKCGDDKQKYQQGMQKIYTEEKVSMGGGCLPMIIRLLLIMSVYYLVTSPITYLKPDVAKNNEVMSAAATVANVDLEKDVQAELKILDKAYAKDTTDENLLIIKEETKDIEFNLFGKISLTQRPHFNANFSDVTKEQVRLWIVPFASFLAALLSGVISMLQQKKLNPDAPRMTGMMLTMPFFSLIIAFNAPIGLGYYWTCSSLIGAAIQTAVQEFYGPYRIIAKEQTKAIKDANEKEKKIKEIKN